MARNGQNSRTPLPSDAEVHRLIIEVEDELATGKNFREHPDADKLVVELIKLLARLGGACAKTLRVTYGDDHGKYYWGLFLQGKLLGTDAAYFAKCFADNILRNVRAPRGWVPLPEAQDAMLARQLHELEMRARVVLAEQDPELFASERWAGADPASVRERLERDRARAAGRRHRAGASDDVLEQLLKVAGSAADTGLAFPGGRPEIGSENGADDRDDRAAQLACSVAVSPSVTMLTDGEPTEVTLDPGTRTIELRYPRPIKSVFAKMVETVIVDALTQDALEGYTVTVSGL